MSGWTKLFSSIVTSSIWCEDNATLRVWIAMLAISDSTGVVEGSVPGFASLARVTQEEMVAAVAKLSSPDPHSRTPDHEGRRIESILGGWRILNYGPYRERVQAKEGSRAPYFREYRRRRATEDVARNTEERRERQEADKKTERMAAAPLPRRRSSRQKTKTTRVAVTLAKETADIWSDETKPPTPGQAYEVQLLLNAGYAREDVLLLVTAAKYGPDVWYREQPRGLSIALSLGGRPKGANGQLVGTTKNHAAALLETPVTYGPKGEAFLTRYGLLDAATARGWKRQ